MVYSKGKAAKPSGAQILEDPRASKNLKDFKIYAGNERAKGLTGAPEWISGSSWKGARKARPVMPRKSMPVDAFAKPAALTGRKALADVSNTSNVKICQPKNRLSYNPKPMKDKLEGGTASQGKRNIVKSPCGLSKNKQNLRISLAKSVVVVNASSRKSIGGKVRGIENDMGKCDNSVRTGRKALSVVSNANNESTCHLRTRLNNNPRSMKDKLEGSTLLRGKAASNVNNPHGPWIWLTRGVPAANASSSKLTGTKSKVKRASMIKDTSIVEKSATINSSSNKEAEVPTRSSCDAGASVSHKECGLEKVQLDGSCQSDETVMTIISKPKCRRRRSYTSSLMARTEIMGECANSIKKDDLPNIDDSTNPLEVVEYVDDIYQYYWTMEVLNPSLANYMTIQSEITPRTRGILINWLIEVHLKFELMQETLFLMVELLDRLLSILAIKKNDLQMVGLTALLLASKYEDFWHPKIDELISISVNSFTKEQMLSMERLILTKLRYRLNIPTPYVFMLRFLKASQSDEKLEHLAFYLIELCLVEYEALRFKPSLLCASAIYVARCTLHMFPPWTGLLQKHARYEESQLRLCAEMILRFQRTAGLIPATTTYEKFLHPDRDRVAVIEPLDKLPL